MKNDRPLNKQELREMLINPFYAIQFAPVLTEDHKPLTSKETWIKANAKLIDEIGKEVWLANLLRVLETGGPSTDAAIESQASSDQTD